MAKRSLDILISMTVLVLGAPLFAWIAIAVIVDSGLPVLFRQRRVGLHGVEFELLKFRSMRVGASGPKVTVAGDARVTRVGRFLRTTKLDEFPQFWNVLSGDMSLVGPRPEVAEYVGLYRERYERILKVRPGITDLASIEYRDEERILSLAEDPRQEYAERVLPAKLDLAEEYIRRQSLRTDLTIIARTALAVALRS